VKNPPLTHSRRPVSVLLARTILVALLTPVIVIAGLIAAAAIPALILSGQLSARIGTRRRPARASVLLLEASAAESSVGL
jgi:hypothetical protein